jgi:general secretion pathway protein D
MKDLKNSIRHQFCAFSVGFDFLQSAYGQWDMSLCKKSNQRKNHQILRAKRVVQFPQMRLLVFFFLFFCASGWCQESIPNKISDIAVDAKGAVRFNATLETLKLQMKEKFDAVQNLARLEPSEEEFERLLREVRAIKGQIAAFEEDWRVASIRESEGSDDPYALWDVGETTISQLVMEYGASDFLYVIPPELASTKISLYTSIPLPRDSWNEMIEAILVHNGIGVRKINSYAKQLYVLKLDPSAIEAIVDREDKLDLFASHSRIFFVFSPPAEQLKSVQSFFERFSDAKQTTVQAIGSKIVIVSTKESVEKLIGLYHAVWEQSGGKIVRVIPLIKIQPAEAEKVLKAVFADASKGRPTFYPSSADELVVLTLPQGLVLVGEASTVDRGQAILHDLECQLEDPGEKLIYWYACKHADPQDIAEVLEKVYDSLIGASIEKKPESPSPTPPPVVAPNVPEGQVFPNAYNPVLPAQAGQFVQPGTIGKKEGIVLRNFIVDNKSTSLLMVVRREELVKIKSLLKKLDVPKRMVQLDVLLVEKKFQDNKEVGINLLQFGENATGIDRSALAFDSNRGTGNGILSYFFSKNKTDTPAMNLKYNFLLAQEDIRINANPQVVAINQTPATISIVEEISLNNGAIQLPTQVGLTVEKSYTRAQFGITIVLTPTIHLKGPDDDDGGDHPGFISLTTNLEFDTTRVVHEHPDRPPVTRRHIENQVCVADGETVILGGLRRRIEEDTREKIPFLGDIPGIGKLFGSTKTADTSTEMFIFITPRIIRDPVDDLRLIRQSEYRKRAGDIPEFLQTIDDAKMNERKSLFDNSMKMFFDLY